MRLDKEAQWDEGNRHFSQLCEFKFQLRHQSGGHTSPYYNFAPTLKSDKKAWRLLLNTAD